MAGLVESFKKVYENKKVHVEVFFIALVWSVLSSLCDTMIKSSGFRQNPFDLVFSFLIGMYSIQFLHNSIVAQGEFPNFKTINWKAISGLIGLNVVWSIYAAVILILAVLSYLLLHSWLFAIACFALILLLSPFVYYIYLAYAEDFLTKGLFNIGLIFNFVKLAVKKTYIKLLLFLLVTIVLCAVFIAVYMFAGYFGFDQFGHIAGDLYVLDFVMFAVMGYLLIIIWYFVFPYSLIKTYIEKVRPYLKGVE